MENPMTADNGTLFRQRGPTTYIEDTVFVIALKLKRVCDHHAQSFCPSLCEYVYVLRWCNDVADSGCRWILGGVWVPFACRAQIGALSRGCLLDALFGVICAFVINVC